MGNIFQKATGLPVFSWHTTNSSPSFFHYPPYFKYCPLFKAMPVSLFISKDFLDYSAHLFFSPLGSHLMFVHHWPLSYTLLHWCYFWMLPKYTVSNFRQVLSVKSSDLFVVIQGPGMGLNVFYFIWTSHSPARLLLLLSVLCRGGSEAQNGSLLKFTYINAYRGYNPLSISWGARAWLEGEFVFGWAGKRRKGFPVSTKNE